MNEKVNQLKLKINEQKTNLIKSQINTKEKYGIDNIDLDTLILNCENPDYNINEMKNYFNSLNSICFSFNSLFLIFIKDFALLISLLK